MCRSFPSLAIALVLFAGCSDAGRRLDGSTAVVEVIETPPPIALGTTPLPLPPVLPLLQAQPLAPQMVYLEPLPPPARHVVRVATSATPRLDLVQSVEVEVEVEGGASGTRHISAVFVSPQGLVWERQGALIDAKPGEKQLAHFSLPVASTFIEQQHLSGTWQITTLDEGLEEASATFSLEEAP
jgi:hypothetical protein